MIEVGIEHHADAQHPEKSKPPIIIVLTPGEHQLSSSDLDSSVTSSHLTSDRWNATLASIIMLTIAKLLR